MLEQEHLVQQELPLDGLTARRLEHARRRAWLRSIASFDTATAAILTLVVGVRLPWRWHLGGHQHIVLAAELALVAGALGLALGSPRRAFRADRVTLFVGVFLLCDLFRAASAHNPWLALRSATIPLAAMVMFLLARAAPKRGALEPVLLPVAVVTASVILEATGLVRGWSLAGHAPGGVLGERNAAAEWVVVALPAVCWTASESRRRGWRGLALGMVGLSVCAIVLARTRSAWLALGTLALGGLLYALTRGNG